MKAILQHYKVEAVISVTPEDIKAAITSACKRLGQFNGDVEYVIPGELPHLVVEVRKHLHPVTATKPTKGKL